MSSDTVEDVDAGVLDSEDSLEQGELQEESHANQIPEQSTYLRDGGADQNLNISQGCLPSDDLISNRSYTSLSEEGGLVEMGTLDTSQSSNISLADQILEYKTAIRKRDAVIQKLTTKLHQVINERSDDSQLSSVLAREINSLKQQVREAAEKASKKKSYRHEFSQLQKETQHLRDKLNIAAGELETKTRSISDKDECLKRLQSELASSESKLEEVKSKSSTEIQGLHATIQSLEGQLQESGSSAKIHKAEMNKLISEHETAIRDLRKSQEDELAALHRKYEVEIQTITDQLEEEQVIEMNLLDMELLALREEKSDLKEKVKSLEAAQGDGQATSKEIEKLTKQQQDLVEKLAEEKRLLGKQLVNMKAMYQEERTVRLSLEKSLSEASSVLDETDYQVIPCSLRLSLESHLGRRHSSMPVNITQVDCGEDSLFFSPDVEKTPVHTPHVPIDIAEESHMIRAIKEEHEREMSELRQYFENYCQEMEQRYRNEFDDHILKQRSVPSRQGLIPLSLEVSQGQLDYSELESISPRSQDSSQLNSLGYCGANSDNNTSIMETRVSMGRLSREDSLPVSGHHHSAEEDGAPVSLEKDTHDKSANMSREESLSVIIPAHLVTQHPKFELGETKAGQATNLMSDDAKNVAVATPKELKAVEVQTETPWINPPKQTVTAESQTESCDVLISSREEASDRSESDGRECEKPDEPNKHLERSPRHTSGQNVASESPEGRMQSNSRSKDVGKRSERSNTSTGVMDTKELTDINVKTSEAVVEISEANEAGMEVSASPADTPVGCSLCQQLKKALEAAESDALFARNEKENAVLLAVEAAKQEMETDHLRKFEAVSKQIEISHATSLQQLKRSMNDEFSDLLEREKAGHVSALSSLKEKLNQSLDMPNLEASSRKIKAAVGDGIYEQLQQDLDQLAEEKRRMKQQQAALHDLVRDLTIHFRLSEKHVKFLTDGSSLFNSLLGDDTGSLEATEQSVVVGNAIARAVGPTETVSHASSTPSALREAVESDVGQGSTANISFMTVSELSNLLGEGSFLTEMDDSGEVLRDLQNKVKMSNETLRSLEPANFLRQLSGLLTPGTASPANITTQQSIVDTAGDSNFVGLEAGRLEVEKARLELELVAAKQRIQELELSGRSSLARSEVISGLGGTGDLGDGEGATDLDTSLGEVREKVAKVLSSVDGGDHRLGDQEAVALLGELLLYSDQMSSEAKAQVNDLAQQLEAADKQLRSTRQFLEEQAVERELEREEWEKKLAGAHTAAEPGRRKRSVPPETDRDTDFEGSSGEEGGEQAGLSRLQIKLDTEAKKIQELTDTLRNMEATLEAKDKQIKSGKGEVDELRVALSEALSAHQAVQQELEALRNSVGDKEMVEHIQGLEEQLRGKTQELQKQRACQLNLQEIKAQLRGMEERLELSTRQLKKAGAVSSSSSRSTSPVLYNGVSYEDIGAASGLELEEVAQLEDKLGLLERAESAAVKRVKVLEEENDLLKGRLDEFAREVQEMKTDKEQLVADRTKVEEELKDLKKMANCVEDLQEENAVLQQTVVSQQMQISTLQAERQNFRHVNPAKTEGWDALQREKEQALNQVAEQSDHIRILGIEKQLLVEERDELRSKLAELEDLTDGDKEQQLTIEKLRKDKEELTEVNEKLSVQLSKARAAELAANKAQMPILAESLLADKNHEIDSLKRQIAVLAGRSPGAGRVVPADSAATFAQSIAIDGSVERLRDASVAPSSVAPSLTSHMIGAGDEAGNLARKFTPDPSRLYSTGFGSVELSLDGTNPAGRGLIEKGRLEPPMSGSHSHAVPDPSLPGQGLVTMAPSSSLPEDVTDFAPDLANPGKEVEDLQRILQEKCEEIESLSMMINEKDLLIYDLQDRVSAADDIIHNLNHTIKNLNAEKVEIEKTLMSRQDVVDRLEAKHGEAVATIKAESTDKCSAMEKARDLLLVEVSELKKAVKASDEACLASKLLAESLQAKCDDYEEKKCQLDAVCRQQQERLDDLENRLINNADVRIAEEVRRLKEENQDRREGMENLHKIIQTTRKELDEKEAKMMLAEQNCQALEAKLDEEKAEHEVKNSEHEQERRILLDRTRQLEAELTLQKKVVIDMATATKRRFEEQKEELATMKENYSDVIKLKDELEAKLSEKPGDAKHVHQDDKNKESLVVSQSAAEMGANISQALAVSVEEGLLETLSSHLAESFQSASNQNEKEKDAPSFTAPSKGSSELGRLVKKINEEGVKVLSLSEKVFLASHAKGSIPSSQADKGEGRQVGLTPSGIQLQVLLFSLEQEQAVNSNLKKCLDAEKRSSLDALSSLTAERQLRSELEQQLNALKKQVEQKNAIIKERLSTVSRATSDNEEFLNTIESQRRQILSLEESLRLERENLSELQHVLDVERRQALEKRQPYPRLVGGGNLNAQFEAERELRSGSSQKEGPEDLGRLFLIDRLERELREERDKVQALTAEVDREKKKCLEMYQEFRQSKQESMHNPTGLDAPADNREEWTQAWRSREYELERLVSELDLKLEMTERREARLKEQVERLQLDLQEQREGQAGGLTEEQLSRMRKVNSFLEMNLRENVEMVTCLAKLHEDKKALRKTVDDLTEKLRHCYCSGSRDARFEVYGRYLRADSFRKALIWQKRFLLAHIAGGFQTSVEPVFKFIRPQLTPFSRFRAVVQVVVSLSRMKYLVKRWRTGKRAGAHLPLSRPLSASVSGSVKSGDFGATAGSPSVSRANSVVMAVRPTTLALALGQDSPAAPRSSVATAAVGSSSPLARSLTGVPPPRNPMRRAHSLRESRSLVGRSERRADTSSPTNSWSSGGASSLCQPPVSVAAGQTPPTRDTGMTGGKRDGAAGVRRRHSDAVDSVQQQQGRLPTTRMVKRNLVPALGNQQQVPPARGVPPQKGQQDSESDLNDYISRFDELQRRLGGNIF